MGLTKNVVNRLTIMNFSIGAIRGWTSWTQEMCYLQVDQIWAFFQGNNYRYARKHHSFTLPRSRPSGIVLPD